MTYQRLLQWISMTTAVICTLWFYTATLDPFNITKLAVLLVGAAALLGLLAGTVKAWWSRKELALVATSALFLAGLTIVALASNQNTYRTIWGAWARNDGWFAYASLGILLLAVAIGFRGQQTRWGLYGLVGVGLVQVGYATLQTFGADPVKWNNGYNAILGTAESLWTCWMSFEAVPGRR